MKKGEVKWAALWLITMTMLILVFASCSSTLATTYDENGNEGHN